MRTLTILLITLITFASVAVAQSKKDKIEVGVQTTSLTLFPPDTFGDVTKGGIGGRVAYNFNRSIAAEAEVNFFPQKQLIFTSDGSSIQAQFGAKVGKRFEKFGVFGKVRPGFLSVSRVISFVPGSQGGLQSNIRIERETFFTTDFGGVLELYPSRRMVVRFDAGDTVIRHPALFGQFDFGGPVVQIRPAKYSNNFQLSAGVAFRLGDFPDEGPAPATSAGTERTKRFEVGAQFTSLFVDPSNSQGALFFPRIHVEPGLGGRVTFNLTESIAFEAEGNYFTRNLFSFPEGGHMFQGQFGGKIGKRFERWGVFGKARPGFVGFSRVLQAPFGIQVGHPLTFVRKFYSSFDVGGVLEFYVSPRWMARFDVGDTIIRYGEIRFPGALSVFTVPGVTRHNLQVSSGIGFRF